MINYPKEFIEKCGKTFPVWKELHLALKNGNEFAGRYLDDSSSETLSIKEILEASSLAKLKEKALLMQDKVNLYKEWYKIYDLQRK